MKKTSPRPVRRLTVLLDQHVAQELKHVAIDRQISASELVRGVVKHFLTTAKSKTHSTAEQRTV